MSPFVLGRDDLVLLVLDTLRYDVAARAHAAGRTPVLSGRLPGGWEARHTPASFTYAAHHAFFAGFLPTPCAPGPHVRRFAVRFGGSETIGPETVVFDAPDVVSGFASAGYRTICVGGVGFFNPETPLGRVLPGFFQEAHWSPELGVTGRDSTRAQVDLAVRRLLSDVPRDQRVFLFVNVSAIHQPNAFFLGRDRDDLDTHEAALAYVDGCLPPLFDAVSARGGGLCVVTSDHGTLYGEDGHVGHRVAHPAVWTVPYGEIRL